MSIPVATLAFSGELNISRYPEIRGIFDSCPAHARRIIVDLGDVAFVDSTFLTELLLFSKRHGDMGATIAIIAGAAIARILGLTRIDQRMRVFPKREDALKYLGHIILAETSSGPNEENGTNGGLTPVVE